ncbi:MAG: PEP-CTERM sorting domain-containing protein [Opitutales bacterium]|nr:PEP-CTERM sorting domain-containing protein [Opitutales bacterium]
MRLIPTSTIVFSLFLTNAAPAFATPVFIEGVSESGGWYDVNKKYRWNDWPTTGYWQNGTYVAPGIPPAWSTLPRDSAMCWAAAGSNILQWWQDRVGVPAANTSVPNGLAATASVNGLQYVSQLQIYQTICSNWTDGGSHVEQAWNWWFNGGMLSTVSFPGSTTLTGTTSSGGYWKELDRTCTQYENASYDTSKLCETYAFWSEPTKEAEFTGLIKRYIDNDYGTTLSLSGAGGHAITLWGYEETAANGLVLYLTDSDDYKHGLFKQAVKMNDEGYLCLSSVDGEEERYAAYNSATGTGLYISEIQALTVPFDAAAPVPEPSAFGLLAGTLALAALSRRRRKVMPR